MGTPQGTCSETSDVRESRRGLGQCHTEAGCLCAHRSDGSGPGPLGIFLGAQGTKLRVFNVLQCHAFPPMITCQGATPSYAQKACLLSYCPMPSLQAGERQHSNAGQRLPQV